MEHRVRSALQARRTVNRCNIVLRLLTAHCSLLTSPPGQESPCWHRTITGMRWYLPDGNPIFWDEVRRQLRGWRWCQLLFLEVIVLGSMLLVNMWDLSPHMNLRDWAGWGAHTFYILIVFQGVMVILWSPLLTAGAITGECERNTAEALWLSPLSSFTIVLGKYLGALITLLLVLCAGMPVLALLYFAGGVSPWEMLGMGALTLLIGAVVTALGLLASCQCRRTSQAYVTALIATLGVIFVDAVVAVGIFALSKYFLILFILLSAAQCFFALRAGMLAMQRRRFDRLPY